MKKPKRIPLRRYNLVLPESVWAALKIYSTEHGGTTNDLIVEACKKVYGEAEENQIEAIVSSKPVPTSRAIPTAATPTTEHNASTSFSFTSIVYSGPEILNQDYKTEAKVVTTPKTESGYQRPSGAALFRKAFKI
jgi:hypothetical protein